jgi:hypothetical protein
LHDDGAARTSVAVGALPELHESVLADHSTVTQGRAAMGYEGGDRDVRT